MLDYKYTDVRIAKQKLRIFRMFERKKARILAFDEVNIVPMVGELFDEVLETDIDELLRISKHYYDREIGSNKRVRLIPSDKNSQDSEKKSYEEYSEEESTEAKRKTTISKKWLKNSLIGIVSPVTGYNLLKEMDRKKWRLVEALAIASLADKAFDRAKKIQASTFEDYAILATDEAVEQAQKDKGIRLVMWITERDDRVCPTCRERDGVIYKLVDDPDLKEYEMKPDKPHIKCRCHTEPVA